MQGDNWSLLTETQPEMLTILPFADVLWLLSFSSNLIFAPDCSICSLFCFHFTIYWKNSMFLDYGVRHAKGVTCQADPRGWGYLFGRRVCLASGFQGNFGDIDIL